MSSTLITKYKAMMDTSCPHSYYPRPQFKRDSFFCLNGEWDFYLVADGKKEVKTKILVPFCPESELSGLGISIEGYTECAYERSFTLPEGFANDRVILHFGAVDQICRVYIGGNKIGEHEGGYLPFSFDITEYIGDGEVSLRVEFLDTLDIKYPYGKQTKKRGGMWYTPVSGIWQTVWLESLPKNPIESLRIEPLSDGVKIKVYGGEYEKKIVLQSGEIYEFCGDEVVIKPESPKLWTPESPYLYNFTLTSGEDKIESYFAIRVVDIQKVDGVSRICLNGKPYVFNGLLDQGYFPDGLFLPATVDGYIDDIRSMKSLGFNMLRKHIKVEPMIFYYLCDREGMAVFQDMVNNGKYSFIVDTALPTIGLQKLSDTNRHKSPESRAIFESTMYGITDLLYNTPSVVYYTIFNEGWGQFCADEMYERLKAKDSTRVIDATSGWFRRSKSDVDSRHIYFKPLVVKDRDDRPLVISEFGGYSYRPEGHLYGEGNYGYKDFKSIEEFRDALVGLYKNQVLPLAISGASAFVYTQVSDVEDETNGLLSYDREVLKIKPEQIKPLMDEISGY